MPITGTTDKPVHPRAASWKVMRCKGTECRHPHLVFFDENENIICDGVIDRNAIDHLYSSLNRAVIAIDEEQPK